MNTKIWELVVYRTKKNELPFQNWIRGLKDVNGRVVIRRRLNRVRLGNFGDIKFLGSGVSEIRIHYGPGYRLYYAVDNDKIILLLLGGDKSTQGRDIIKAKNYWSDYLLENRKDI